jgi:hypothetical protein
MRAALLALCLGLAAAAWGGVPISLAGAGAAAAVHGRFTQSKTVDGLSRPLLSRGTFSLLPGRGLVWRTLSPLQGTVVLSPKGVYALDGAASRRLAAGTEPLALMNEVLSGDVVALRRSFVVRREGDDKAWRLVLVPLPGPLAVVVKSIEAEGASFARKARLVEASGDVTEIRFESVEAGAGPLDRSEESLLGP